MQKLILPFLLLVGTQMMAQHYCHTTEKQNEWFEKHPELRSDFEKHQQHSAAMDQLQYKNGYTTSAKSAAAGVYTIPVVFHILHTGGTENISDAQIQDAVNILTRDFNATNADTADVVVPFKNLIGNAQIDFVLATKDPSGNCTNGITRHFDVNTDWQGGPSNYAYSWPATRYLNIYVVRTMGGGAAGYTYLPGSGVPAAMDAIVILNGYVGSMGTANLTTSRALTHEVGHWLNLPHVWGSTNQPGVACGDDGVTDTPVSKGYTSCNLASTQLCNPGVPENVQNYMDYAYCQRMYTIGQASRMQNALNSPVNGRNNLSSANNLTLTGVVNPGVNCLPKLDIAALPSATVCSGRTLNVSSFTFNAAPTSYSWTASSGGSISNPTAASTPVLFTSPGIVNITCVVTNAGGSNSKTISVEVLDGATQIVSEQMESFENSDTDPPAMWNIINPTTPTQKWEVTSPYGSEGSVSMYVPGEKLSANTVEILESPSYDFKHNPGAFFSFKYAYALKSSSQNDLFKVQASKNCGATWSDVWVPLITTLAQNSGEVRSQLFYPESTEWKAKVLSEQPQFFPFLSEEHVNIRFYFKEGNPGFGNRFYLDEVHFGSSSVGINELSRAIGLAIYPNPINSAFHLSFRLSDATRVRYEVVTIAGAVMRNTDEKIYAPGDHEIKINEQAELTPGIYFINLELNGVKMSRKVIVQ